MTIKDIKKNKTNKKQSGEAQSMAKLREKLKGTPFEKRIDLVKAQNKILNQEWDKLERARIRRDLISREEYNFVLDSFQKGYECSFTGGKSAIKIYMDGTGVQKIDINEDFKEQENFEPVVGNLAKLLSESFQLNYLKVTGLVELGPSESHIE